MSLFLQAVSTYVNDSFQKHCYDSVRQCYDSLRVISKFIQSTQIHPADNSLTVTNWITIIITVIGIGGTWITLSFKGGKLVEKLGHLNDHVSDIKIDVKKIPILEVKVDAMWVSKYAQSQSPLQLNERGKKVLTDSAISEIVDNKYNDILETVKKLAPKNAYEAQEFIQSAVNAFMNDAELKNTLESRAFKTGENIFVILFVGSIYIRDRIIKELGFSVDDIDKYAPTPPNPTT